MSPPVRLLAGKTAIITGGTTGIGRAICLEYLRQGADVVVSHLGLEEDREHVESLVAEAEALRIQGSEAGDNDRQMMTMANSFAPVGRLVLEVGDVRDPMAAQRLVARAVELPRTQDEQHQHQHQQQNHSRRLDICVSNAGICTFADLLDTPPSLMAETTRTNLDGAFYITQAAAQQMARNQTPPGGSIIGISSISALVGGARQVHYTPSKAGVLSLMQSAAAALGCHDIRCNALLPGTVATRLNAEDMADPEKRSYMEGRIPLGRLGRPGDLAGPAVFLACEEMSGYVTGAQLLVDGGLFVNLQ